MIIYNKTWLANLRLQATLKKDLLHGYITPVEFKSITEKYPVGFYTPNLFARIGLFILTCIIVSFGDGLISLLFSSSGLIDSFGWFFFLGLVSYVGLELMVSSNHHFRSGVDDALLFISGCLFVTGFVLMFSRLDDGTHYWPLSGIVSLLMLYLSIRFADMLTSIICCISFLAFMFFGWIKIVPAGLSTAPFAMMLVSGGIYWLSRINSKKEKFINYDNVFVITQVVGLVALYAAGNYYAIQKLSSEMANHTGPIPFGAFFWAWTVLLPFIYIVLGIKKKDVILLRTGLLLITAAAVTFRNYYHVLPVDITLTIIGVLVLGIVYAITKYLKIPKHGFTCAETEDGHLMDHLKIESLVIAETFSHAPSAPTDEGVKFGGGDFGGGGSGGGF
ncbi:hypothetical protein [Mucilaginibacter lappiensis]|uniref:Putative membrane protein YgcG n=1 Tax=Mucilaginibacter lappiensis TaxID=354630 RepID=A0A841JEY8_9SPHI|nr:hypothetical protein [Mucilaginibacter lappiensis]MBB6127208.1 putative membrane protein YgcG [Mucilaginibacter lappiensis]